MKHEFKVGQRVRCVENVYAFTIGKVYTVTGFYENGVPDEGGLDIDKDDNGCTDNGAWKSCFEPADDAPRPEFYVGQKVRCLEDYDEMFTKGKIYIVSGFYDTYGLNMEIDDVGSTTNGWNKKYFEPAEPPPVFAVGGELKPRKGYQRVTATYGTPHLGKAIVQPCTCDFHSVVMVSGCQCGAML